MTCPAEQRGRNKKAAALQRQAGSWRCSVGDLGLMDTALDAYVLAGVRVRMARLGFAGRDPGGLRRVRTSSLMRPGWRVASTPAKRGRIRVNGLQAA